MMTAEQLRAARALLRMEQTALAEKAGVSVETIKRLERQDGRLQAHFETLRRIKQALELAGVELLDGSKSRGAGVRLIPVDSIELLVEQANHFFARTLGHAIERLMRVDPQFWGRPDARSMLEEIASAALRELPRALHLVDIHNRPTTYEAAAQSLRDRVREEDEELSPEFRLKLLHILQKLLATRSEAIDQLRLLVWGRDSGEPSPR